MKEGEGIEERGEGMYGKCMISPATHLLSNHALTKIILYVLSSK